MPRDQLKIRYFNSVTNVLWQSVPRDVGIAVLAILSHEDGIRSFGPLSSENVAVVVDFNWFTDCHLEAIFCMNTSRLRLDLRDSDQR